MKYRWTRFGPLASGEQVKPNKVHFGSKTHQSRMAVLPPPLRQSFAPNGAHPTRQVRPILALVPLFLLLFPFGLYKAPGDPGSKRAGKKSTRKPNIGTFFTIVDISPQNVKTIRNSKNTRANSKNSMGNHSKHKGKP